MRPWVSPSRVSPNRKLTAIFDVRLRGRSDVGHGGISGRAGRACPVGPHLDQGYVDYANGVADDFEEWKREDSVFVTDSTVEKIDPSLRAKRWPERSGPPLRLLTRWHKVCRGGYSAARAVRASTSAALAWVCAPVAGSTTT